MSDSPVSFAYETMIKLADNSEWNGSAGLDVRTQSLWIWLDGYAMGDVFASFNDPGKTALITASVKSKLDYDKFKTEYRGYTNLSDLQSSGRRINICLTKPVNPET